MIESFLCITVRFLGGTFHGRGDRGEPEWPPSPLRLFQALVATAAGGHVGGGLLAAAPALRWLEVQEPPLVIAPTATVGAKHRLYVPDNVGDLVAGAWSRGNSDADIANFRTEKDVRPTHVSGSQAAVGYVWELREEAGIRTAFAAHREPLLAMADSTARVGWGIDLAAVHAAVISREELDAMPGRRWRPSREAAGGDKFLRVSVAGTLADLERRHAAFLARTAGGRFAPVPPLAVFASQPYADDAAPAGAPTAAFELLQPDASGYRFYDPARDGMRVAGMLRHAAAESALGAALGWTEDDIRRTVLGHGETHSEANAHVPVNGPRVAFLPLPSLETRSRRPGAPPTVGGIRRAVLAGSGGLGRDPLHALARLLSGQTLTEEKSQAADALLSRLPDSDPTVRRYVSRSAVWTTVTPVILPGHDDRAGYRRRLFPCAETADGSGEAALPPPGVRREWLSKLDARIDALLRKAIRQGGYNAELAQHVTLDWRGTGFLPGIVPAAYYQVPQKLRRFRRLHVRIEWRNADGVPVEVPGPVSLGGGRFVGLGLFCAWG